MRIDITTRMVYMYKDTNGFLTINNYINQKNYHFENARIKGALCHGKQMIIIFEKDLRKRRISIPLMSHSNKLKSFLKIHVLNRFSFIAN